MQEVYKNREERKEREENVYIYYLIN